MIIQWRGSRFFGGLKLVQFWGPSLRKRIQNYAYKIRYESEYLSKMRKEITTNYIFKKLTDTTNATESSKTTQYFIN